MENIWPNTVKQTTTASLAISNEYMRYVIEYGCAFFSYKRKLWSSDRFEDGIE